MAQQSKTILFRMRLTPDESERLSNRAEKAGLTKSDYIRKKLEFPFTPSKKRQPPSRDLLDQVAVAPDSPLGNLAARIRQHST